VIFVFRNHDTVSAVHGPCTTCSSDGIPEQVYRILHRLGSVSGKFLAASHAEFKSKSGTFEERFASITKAKKPLNRIVKWNFWGSINCGWNIFRIVLPALPKQKSLWTASVKWNFWDSIILISKVQNYAVQRLFCFSNAGKTIQKMFQSQFIEPQKVPYDAVQKLFCFSNAGKTILKCCTFLRCGSDAFLLW